MAAPNRSVMAFSKLTYHSDRKSECLALRQSASAYFCSGKQNTQWTIPLHTHSLLRESTRYLACCTKLGQPPVSLSHIRRGAMTCSHMPRGTPQAPMQELTHPVIVVTDFDDGFVLPEIPHSSSAARAGRCQDVLDLPVPCDTADVLERLSHIRGSLTKVSTLQNAHMIINNSD